MTTCWILAAFSVILNLRIDAAWAEDRLGLVFWISNEADSITSYVKMATLNSDVVNPSIISNGTTLSALAVDWISDRVYWTNTNDRQIKVFDISTGSILVFMDTGYDTSPLGIAVDPIMGDFVRISALQAVDKSRQPNVMPLANPTNADIERQVIKLPVSVPLLNGQTASLTTTEKPKVAITSTHSAQGSRATSTNLLQNKVAVSTQTIVQNRPVQQTRTGSAVQVMTSSSTLVKISPITSPIKSAPIKTNTASIQGTRTVAGNSAVNTPSMVPSSIPQQTPSALISTVSSSIPQQTPSAKSSQLNATIASFEVPSGDSAVTAVLKISETLTPSSISMTAAIEALGTATVSYNDPKIPAETIKPSSSTAIAFSEQSSATPLVTFITTIEPSSPALYDISTSTPALFTAFTSFPASLKSSPAASSISTSSPQHPSVPLPVLQWFSQLAQTF
ncbi:hypothetical protein EMCRGX_G014579 [Ephydatia muelleri]